VSAESFGFDSRTTLDIQSEELARLIDGRMRLAMVGRGLTYRIDSPAGSVRVAQPGEFKLSMLHGDNETQLELAVIRGTAEIFTDQGSTSVRAGERAYASAGLAPSYLTFALWTPVLGLTALTMITAGNATVQLGTTPMMRGRVMALYMMIFMGGTPVGAPIVGWIGETFGARWTLIGGGLGTIVGVLLAAAVFSRSQGMLDPEVNDRPRLRKRGRAPELVR